MPKKPVKVYWYPAEERGRKAPPAGTRYYGVIELRSENSTTDQWSVLLEFDPRSEHPFWREGMMSFVSDKAPLTALQPGMTFHLFEGRWPVAEGVVLQSREIGDESYSSTNQLTSQTD
jgi:hypothetical protein